MTPASQVVWQYGGLNLPYDADRLPNGNTLIADGRVIEVDTTEAIVWQYPPVADQPYWPTWGYDQYNTSRSPHPGPQSAELAWTYMAEKGRVINQQQTVDANGTMYFATWGSVDEDIGNRARGMLYALNPDGSLKWIYDPGPLEGYYLGTIETSPTIGPDGTIYFGRGDGILRAVNPDGTLKWAFETIPNTNGRGQIFPSPVVSEEGIIYFGTGDYALWLGLGNNIFYALEDKGDHAEIKWTFPSDGSSLNNWIFCNPAIGDDGTVYFSSGRTLYAFGTDGQEQWHYTATDRMWNPTIGEDGTIYVQAFNYNANGVVYALSPDGSLKWTYPIAEPVVSGISIGSDDTLYFGSDTGQDAENRLVGKLYALVDCGQDCVQEKWLEPIDFGLNVRKPTIDAEGTLYVALRGDLDVTPPIPGRVVALRDTGHSGEILWSVEANGEIWMASPVIGPDNTLYFADVVCIDYETCDDDIDVPSVYAIKEA